MKRLVLRRSNELGHNVFVVEVGTLEFYRTMQEMEAARDRLNVLFTNDSDQRIYAFIEEVDA